MKQLPFRLPERSLTWGQLRRGVGIWLVLRLVIVGAAAIAVRQSDHDPFAISFEAALGLIAITGALAWLDSQRLNEHRFSANLGIPIAFTVLWSILPAVVFEAVLPLTGVR